MRNSLADVVAAALRVLSAQGLEGCSMRRVAAELGVQPSALYHHVPDKQTLLALMADEIVAGVGGRARRSAAEHHVSGAGAAGLVGAAGPGLAGTGLAGTAAVGTGSAVTKPLAMGLAEGEQADVGRGVARRMCKELRDAMLATRDGADVVATAAAFRMGASGLEDELAELVGRDGARTLLIYTFGQAQQTQMHRQAAAFGALVDTTAVAGAVVAPADTLDEAFARGIDVILTGLAV